MNLYDVFKEIAKVGHGTPGVVRRFVAQDNSTIELQTDGIDAYLVFKSPSGKNVQRLTVGWIKTAETDEYKETTPTT